MEHQIVRYQNSAPSNSATSHNRTMKQSYIKKEEHQQVKYENIETSNGSAM